MKRGTNRARARDTGQPDMPLYFEILLCEIWADISGGVSIGVVDNYFDADLDSLKMIRFLNRVRNRCGVELGVRDLFMYPTVQSLSLFLAEEISKTRGSDHTTS